MDKEKQNLLQEKYIEMQIIEQQLSQIQKQIQLLESQFSELSIVEQALEDLSKVEIGSKILVPVSPGIFLNAELKDNNNLIVNVGSDVAVGKDIPSTKNLINRQITEIKQFQEQMMMELQRLAMKAQEKEKEINKIVG